jgi:sugar/nucleoside kinase (ribokinase family)
MGRRTSVRFIAATMPPMSDRPFVCVVGCASWDTLLPVDRYPPEGEYCIATGEIELPGGTSTNAAITLARLGLPTRFVGMVGDDWRGERLRAGLEAAGVLCDTLAVRHGQDSDRSVIPISPSGSRTIFWIKGATIEQGDVLDTDLIFSHRILYLDIVDLALWRDLLDAYDRQAARHDDPPLRVGQAVYVAGVMPPDEAMALISRHDTFIGGEWEWKLMTGTTTRMDLFARVEALVESSPLATGVITLGAEGCAVITRDRTFIVAAAPVTVVDTTGAGDAFAGGYMYGLGRGWGPARCAQFANAVGGLATRAFGSQASLPTLDEAWRLAFDTAPDTT